MWTCMDWWLHVENAKIFEFIWVQLSVDVNLHGLVTVCRKFKDCNWWLALQFFTGRSSTMADCRYVIMGVNFCYVVNTAILLAPPPPPQKKRGEWIVNLRTFTEDMYTLTQPEAQCVQSGWHDCVCIHTCTYSQVWCVVKRKCGKIIVVQNGRLVVVTSVVWRVSLLTYMVLEDIGMCVS